MLIVETYIILVLKYISRITKKITMAKILVNDGMHQAGIDMLIDARHQVDTNNIPQGELMEKLVGYDAICVRSATRVRADLIDNCPNLKIIGRGGVGLDNIDVDHAKAKGIHVLNTPAASSRSVAELAMGHLLSVARYIHDANLQMPTKGTSDFKSLKKSYSKGFELEGKKLGIIGFGRIGQETARIALGLGMEVLAVDPYQDVVRISVGPKRLNLSTEVKTVDLATMLSEADAISLHIPNAGKPVLAAAEFDQMKDGVVLINASRGGTVDEDAMMNALNSGKLRAAGLDVFVGEPNPRKDILSHANVSSTPHIGASTVEAQIKIGQELAQQIIDRL